MPLGAVLMPPLPVVVAAARVNVEAAPPVPEAMLTLPEVEVKVRLLIEVAASSVVLRLPAVGVLVEKTTSVTELGSAPMVVLLVALVLKLAKVCQLEFEEPLQ